MQVQLLSPAPKRAHTRRVCALFGAGKPSIENEYSISTRTEYSFILFLSAELKGINHLYDTFL